MYGLAASVLLFVVATTWWLIGPRSPFPWGPKIKLRRRAPKVTSSEIVQDWNAYLDHVDGRRYP